MMEYMTKIHCLVPLIWGKTSILPVMKVGGMLTENNFEKMLPP